MKPVTSVSGSIIVTVAIIFSLGFLASTMAGDPTSAADQFDQANGESVQGLEIIIAGIRNDKGRIIFAVFDRAEPFEAYDYDRAIEYGEFDADRAVQGAVRIPLPNLDDGPYAVSFFHDENNDYDFNMDRGWPLEGFGTSGADDAYDEPTFEEASIIGGRVIIQMYYL